MNPNNYFQFLSARLTKDPEIKYLPNQRAFCNLVLAVDRFIKKGNEFEKKTDFPRVTVWGEEAEKIKDKSGKGLRVNVYGRIETGSYESDDKTIYTTDLIAEKVTPIDYKNKPHEKENPEPPAFSEIDADIPF